MHQDPITLSPSRHNRWYERLLLNSALGHLMALASIILGAQFISYQAWVQNDNQAITLGLLGMTYLICVYLGKNISKFAGGKAMSHILGTCLVSVALVIAIVLLLRLEYARSSLVVGVGVLLSTQVLAVVINRRFKNLKLAFVPSDNIEILLPRNARNLECRLLQTPDLGDSRFDGIAVDMDAKLTAEWIRFISHCNISGIPVFNARKVTETLDGKVNLSSLQSTDLANLQPQPVYLAAKRAFDIMLTLVIAPLLLPACLLVAILIRLDSPGPAIFVQHRIGKGNTVFRMYKFRSMRPQSDDNHGPQFADQDAHRITRLGAFIRKFRIDELPQFFNVIKGDMSLIGPRPEQPGFVEKFEEEVPYYSYRHIVRPGITGWAQVNHGYAADTETTREKVEHDFYYIKNLSPALDFLVIIRTMKTIATGFGAM
ncbi:exopolysaccharide biosynthesis polyprenyl glycosylphosphotransferase [Alcanivorax sp.]|uniref:exopolysaccharide biosynthesis polyprenyl glycosylphosphotransferase n=1 Tax=Alcanivorax sp. TaxID=1872427 RepID=UPI0025BE35B0|nr:exopolysaccharide biosynthesis polyprenyl glycosylphosphotransferase [Alcanivorax sp.]